MISLIQDTIEEYKDIVSYQLIWEILKIHIKEFTIRYATNKSKNNKSNILNLQNKLDNIKEEIDNNKTNNTILLEEKSKLQKELNNCLENESKGAFIRTRSNWYEHAEKCSSFFLNLEKQKQSNNTIDKLKDTQGKHVYKDTQILEMCANYYDKLYSSKNINIETINDYLNNTNFTNKLSQNERNDCDEPITLDEINKIVISLKENKSPGLDGLTAEFYKHFWNDLKHIFLEMIIETKEKGIMPETMRRAVVTLIYKKVTMTA